MSDPESPLTRVPQHVAIIMDGNGRWARARGLPRAAGHKAGTENLRNVLPAAVEFGIKVLTVYAFSTENWDRPRREVSALLMLIEQVIDSELAELHRSGVCLRHIGSTDRLDRRLVEKIAHAQELTRDNDRLIVNIAFNYGGRAELVQAVRRIVAEGIRPEDITEAVVESHLYTAGLPDPDLIIRTGGDMRVSNFLVWQGVYAELYSTQTFWPDFGRDQLWAALEAYQGRERRFGGLNPTA